MIIGIGNDIIEINRIEKACVKEAFLLRVYTEKEISASNHSASFLAGNFAVKEAVSKTFGTGVSGFSLKEIEVLRDERGKPYVVLSGKADEKAKSLGIKRIHVSISNTQELVSAIAVAED